MSFRSHPWLWLEDKLGAIRAALALLPHPGQVDPLAGVTNQRPPLSPGPLAQALPQGVSEGDPSQSGHCLAPRLGGDVLATAAVRELTLKQGVGFAFHEALGAF